VKPPTTIVQVAYVFKQSPRLGSTDEGECRVCLEGKVVYWAGARAVISCGTAGARDAPGGGRGGSVLSLRVAHGVVLGMGPGRWWNGTERDREGPPSLPIPTPYRPQQYIGLPTCYVRFGPRRKGVRRCCRRAPPWRVEWRTTTSTWTCKCARTIAACRRRRSHARVAAAAPPRPTHLSRPPRPLRAKCRTFDRQLV
jgi:hypothetical protein